MFPHLLSIVRKIVFLQFYLEFDLKNENFSARLRTKFQCPLNYGGVRVRDDCLSSTVCWMARSRWPAADYRPWEIDRHSFRTRFLRQPRWAHNLQTSKSTLRTDLRCLGNITKHLLPPLFHLLPPLFYFRNSPHSDAWHLWTSTFTPLLPFLFRIEDHHTSRPWLHVARQRVLASAFQDLLVFHRICSRTV